MLLKAVYLTPHLKLRMVNLGSQNFEDEIKPGLIELKLILTFLRSTFPH